MTADAALYVGEQDAEFYKAKDALTGFVQSVETVKSVALAKSLLQTQNISLIILNLHLDPKQTFDIVQEIRADRPRISFIAVGRMSFPQVIEYNYYCIARGIDGTFTVEQFKTAMRTVERQNLVRFWGKIGLGFTCIIGIVIFGVLSASPVGKFLGAFWATLLVIEFAYYLILVQGRWKRI